MTDLNLTASSSPNPKKDWLSLLQLIFSALVFLVFFGISILASVNWVAGLSGNMILAKQASLFSALSLSFLLFSLLAILSVISSAFRVVGRPQPGFLMKKMTWLKWIDLLMLVTWVGGYFISSSSALANTLLPILTVFGVLFPVLWLLRVGVKGQWGKHPQRSLGLLTFSFGFSTWVILFIELIAIVMMLVFVGLVSSTNPGLKQLLSQLTLDYQSFANTPQQFLQTVQSLLSNPLIAGSLILLMAGIVPLIEELFKTLGVWLLGGRRISPAEGYVAGLMSGAGFALIEGLLNSASITFPVAGGDWLAFVIGRLGGSLIHIFNGGLIGWALAKSWQDRKYGRMVGAYLAAILIHGLWNGLAVFAGLSPLFHAASATSTFYYLPLGIVFIAVFIIFFAVSNKLHRSITPIA